MSELTTDTLVEIQRKILDEVKKREEELTKIYRQEASLIEKWQLFLTFIIPIQLSNIEKYGFDSNQIGLSEFHELCMSADDKRLQALNRERWEYIFQKAFGINETKEISLEEARTLVKEISKEMISEAFLTHVSKEMSLLSPEAPMVQKRMTLLNILIPLHMSVMGRRGFEGEEGYLQAQTALLDYFSDPEIKQSSREAQEQVFKRAGLM